jgi:TPP-dependent pyruvate/acetoin dehydrogenase alpha subunit
MNEVDLIKKLYRDALRIRLVEEQIARSYPEEEMRCPVHLSIGQEGIAVGVMAALKAEDKVLSGHRAHAHYLAKGGDLKAMLAEIYGKSTGCCKGRGGSMHLIDLKANFIGSAPIVAGTIPIAVGTAYASKLRKQNDISVIFFGDAAVEEGVFYESLNFAAVKKLPILFVCENNFYSIFTPLSERQPNRPIADLAKSRGVYTDVGDGNNALEVFDKTQKAVQLLRRGEGPAFLEFETYRFLEHCGPNSDDYLGYRDAEEVKAWKSKCPVLRLKESILEKNIVNTVELDLVEKELGQEVEDAFIFAKQSPMAEEVLTQESMYA